MTDVRPGPRPRTHYRHWSPLQTRWADNDLYGHVNNVVYYGWFDTLVNRMLIERGALDLQHGGVVGFVVETRCNYHLPLAFPQALDGGVAVSRLGRSSVRYDIGIFAAGAPLAAAAGHFIHVYVDRDTRRPVPLPDALVAALQPLLIE